jgi:hypothetical protein
VVLTTPPNKKYTKQLSLGETEMGNQENVLDVISNSKKRKYYYLSY